MQQAFETFARAAATFAVFLIALVVLLSILKDFKAKLDYDWPFIVAYTALFLCIAAMMYVRGSRIAAPAMAVFAMAIAVFDTLENLDAYRTGALQTSAPKWFCFFVCVLLTVPLLWPGADRLARVAAGGLLLAGLLGVIGSFWAARNPKLVFGAAALSILAFIPAVVVFVRRPQVLLS